MIQSVSYLQDRSYQEYLSQKVSKTSDTSSQTEEQSNAVEDLLPIDLPEYSSDDFMEMMQSGKKPPEIPPAMEEETDSETEEEAGDISSIDADGDGTISADEYETMMSALGISDALSSDEFFELYDADGDGEITVDEMPEPGTAGMGEPPMMGEPPAMPMGEISEEDSEDEISIFDTNGDGVVSADELPELGEAGMGEPPAMPMGGISEEDSEEEISIYDTDGDGTISADEYEEMISEMGIPDALSAEEFYERFDTNGDGEISEDEMPEPGSIRPEDASSDESELETSISSEMLQALQAYEQNFESMFARMDGTLLNNQA